MATRRSRGALTERTASSRRAEAPRSNRGMHTGEEAMRRTDEELERQKKRRESGGSGRSPYRFFVPVGQTKEIVILDDEPSCFIYEHTLQDPRTRKWDLRLQCIAEWETCPVCEAHGPAPYIMFLSVLDLTPFKTKDGMRDFSRKLLPVKISNQKKFTRRWKKDGSLRGAIFECSRDGEKDPAIGNDIEFIEYMDEEELSNDFIRTWVDRDKKTHTENCGEPFDYLELFPEPTAAELYAIVGGDKPAGNREETRRDIGMDDTSGDEWEDEGEAEPPWEDEKSEPTRSSRGSRRSRSVEPEPEPTRRSSRRTRAAEPEPAPTRRSSRRAAEVEEEEEERPARSTRARRGRTR